MMFISFHGLCNGVILEFCSGVLSQHFLFFLQVWYIVSEGENKNEKIINRGDNLTIFRKRKQEMFAYCLKGFYVRYWE